MAKRKEFYMENAGAISAGAVHYPFTESGAPTEEDRRNDFPLLNFKIENKSGVEIELLLDPVGTTATQKFIIPNGQTLSSLPAENFKFFQIAIINNGVIDADATKIKTSVRNY